LFRKKEKSIHREERKLKDETGLFNARGIDRRGGVE
jgi:hypothetical protein